MSRAFPAGLSPLVVLSVVPLFGTACFNYLRTVEYDDVRAVSLEMREAGQGKCDVVLKAE